MQVDRLSHCQPLPYFGASWRGIDPRERDTLPNQIFLIEVMPPWYGDCRRGKFTTSGQRHTRGLPLAGSTDFGGTRATLARAYLRREDFRPTGSVAANLLVSPN